MGLCSVCQLCAWGSNSLIGPRKGYTGYECAALHSGDIQYRVVPIISYKITCFSMKTWFYQRNKRCLSVQIVFSMPRFTRTLLLFFATYPKCHKRGVPFLCRVTPLKSKKWNLFCPARIYDIWIGLAHHHSWWSKVKFIKKNLGNSKTYTNLQICLEFSGYPLRIDIMSCTVPIFKVSCANCKRRHFFNELKKLRDWQFFLLLFPLQMQNHSIVSGVPGPRGQPVVSAVVGAERRAEKGVLPRLPVGMGHPVVPRMQNRPFYAHELRNAQ